MHDNDDNNDFDKLKIGARICKRAQQMKECTICHLMFRNDSIQNIFFSIYNQELRRKLVALIVAEIASRGN
jgi:hypothetical protein